MAMDASVNYLMNIVKSEIRHAENIFHFLCEKEQALIHNDMPKLKELILKEHSLFVRSRELEVSRCALLEVISKKLLVPLKNLTLTVLAEKVSPNYRGMVMEMRNELKTILEKVRHQNGKCELLLKKSMELVSYSLNLVTGKFRHKTKMVYDRNKRPEEKYYAHSIFDKRG